MSVDLLPIFDALETQRKKVMTMKKKSSFMASIRHSQFVVMSAVALLTGAAQADITAWQAQALAEDSARQIATFFMGVMGGCASTYPDTRNDAVKALRAMTSSLSEEEATKFINGVAQCMNTQSVPTKTQCSDLAAKLPSRDFDPDDKQFEPAVMSGLEMLEPCRRRN